MFGFAHCCIPNASLSACHTEGTQYLWNELLLSDVCLGAHLLVSLQPTDLAVLGGGRGGCGQELPESRSLMSWTEAGAFPKGAECPLGSVPTPVRACTILLF